MLGFVIGTVCLVALVAMARRRRWMRWGGGCGRGGGWGGGGWRRGVLRHVFERLQTTPGQEKVVVSAVEEVVGAARGARDGIAGSRDDVARAVGGEVFDEGALGSAFARQREAFESLERAVAGALARVHDALDERQRAELARLIARGPSGFGGGPGFAHPYRGV